MHAELHISPVLERWSLCLAPRLQLERHQSDAKMSGTKEQESRVGNNLERHSMDVFVGAELKVLDCEADFGDA